MYKNVRVTRKCIAYC